MPRVLLASVLLLVLPGCLGERPPETPRSAQYPTASLTTLITYLENDGVEVRPMGLTVSTALLGIAHQLAVPGGALQVYEYASEAKAEADLAEVIRQGLLAQATSAYQRDRIVVVHFGDEPTVDRTLVRTLGMPRL